MSDKRNQANPRRAFPTWLHALYMAVSYGGQTGYKWRVYRAGTAWRITRTAIRYQHGPDSVGWDRFRAATGRPPWTPNREPIRPGHLTIVFRTVGPIQSSRP